MRGPLGYVAACGLTLVALLPLFVVADLATDDQRLVIAGFVVGVFDALVLPRLWRRLGPG